MRKLRLVLALLTATLAFWAAAVAAPGDVDNDIIPDASDNCPTVYNIDQFDDDADSVGNTCDATPGIPLGGSQTIIYHRDVTTGGPLSADPSSSRCVSASLVGFTDGVQDGVNTTNCYRRFTFGTVFATNQQVVFTVLADPPGCQRLYTSPITVTYHGASTVTVINAYYLCDEALLFANLSTASVGVGPGKSLTDKVALAQSQYASGDVAGACVTLTGYINQVNALAPKKITSTTANALVTQATALKTQIGC